MKLIVFFSLLFASFQVFANIEEGICSKTTTVCASYKSAAPFISKAEGRFGLFLKSEAADEIQLMKVDLWMQMGNHGHGSSPLTVTPVAPNEFDVTKAYFVMKGNWQIRVKYKQGSNEETLIIPVMIKE